VDLQRARRVVAGQRRGSSRPVVLETEQGLFLTKLRGAAQGPAVLAAEVIVAELAAVLGLDVPGRVLVSLDEGAISPDRDPELTDLLAASHGINLGFQLLEGAREIGPAEAEAADDAFACRVLWLDALVMNVDRTPRNPNVLVGRGRRWLIDHGAALPFQYNWAKVTEDSPRSPAYPLDRHLFAPRAGRLAGWDARLAALLSREALERAVAAVPDAFLLPLVASGSGEVLARRRKAYEAFLWKRLKAPRPFVPPVADRP
jgi:HipA-like protein